MNSWTSVADDALRDARPAVMWTDVADRPEATSRLSARTRADLVIVGAGYTGLWAAAAILTAVSLIFYSLVSAAERAVLSRYAPSQLG